jgi:hypothetical protein
MKVPVHYVGNSSETFHHHDYETEALAIKKFEWVKHRLLNVNKWHKHLNMKAGEFQLTNADGFEVEDLANIGYLIKINLRAPLNTVGQGFDWVRIEDLELDENTCWLRLRPTACPVSESNNTAHFFKSAATNTLEVTRTHHRIQAAFYGRNEVINTDRLGIMNKMRNWLVGKASMLGVSPVHWADLLKGIIGEQKG